MEEMRWGGGGRRADPLFGVGGEWVKWVVVGGESEAGLVSRGAPHSAAPQVGHLAVAHHYVVRHG